MLRTRRLVGRSGARVRPPVRQPDYGRLPWEGLFIILILEKGLLLFPKPYCSILSVPFSMAENAPALYILQKGIKRGRTLILERNIKAPFAPRGKVSQCFYEDRAQPGPMGRACLNFIRALFHGRK